MVAGRPAEAHQAFRKALELAPQRVATHLLESLVFLEEGRDAEALAAAQLEPAPWARLAALSVVHHAAGRTAESAEALREMEEKWSDDSACLIAAVHAARKEPDAAFDWLERAYLQRDPGLSSVLAEPMFRALHDDARWLAFLGKMGLGE